MAELEGTHRQQACTHQGTTDPGITLDLPATHTPTNSLAFASPLCALAMPVSLCPYTKDLHLDHLHPSIPHDLAGQTRALLQPSEWETTAVPRQLLPGFSARVAEPHWPLPHAPSSQYHLTAET